MRIGKLTGRLLADEQDVHAILEFTAHLPGGSTVTDLVEIIQLPSVRARTRLWHNGHGLAAFALVDDYCNLWFDLHPRFASAGLEDEIAAWGVLCVRRINAETGEEGSLDACCSADHLDRVAFLERRGFRQADFRTLRYARPLDLPLPSAVLPPGFSIRPVLGHQEIDALVALHRSAFATDQMTVEYRLAIMRSPQYVPELDLVVVEPGGELCAFCICGFEDESGQAGYTDPVGAHPQYRRIGLAKAVLASGLRGLEQRGAKTAGFGTGSDNIPMQRLAESLGFQLVSQGLWFSLPVD